MKKLLHFILYTFYFLLTPSAYAAEVDPGGGGNSGPGAVDIGSNVRSFFGFTCIQHFVFRIVDIGILLSGLLLFVYLVWGGFEWLTSGGDKGKVEAARSKLTNAIVGVAIIASAFAVWKVALTFFGVDLTNICTINPI